MTPSKFRQKVYSYYRRAGRHHLPWRKTHDPYSILVSEIMLQQTQVDRVIPYYERFLNRFPTVEMLAEASLGDVLRHWQGLGYNRRAKMLHECAKKIVRDHSGRFPESYDTLLSLPGVGPYTAGAVMAFAYNAAVTLIETNVRALHIQYFFAGRYDVRDAEIMPVIEQTLDRKQPRIWYAALMDFGAYEKKMLGNASRRSAHHVVQSRFKGSDREVRGAILTFLSKCNSREATIIKKLGFERRRTVLQLTALTAEGLIVRTRGIYKLP